MIRTSLEQRSAEIAAKLAAGVRIPPPHALMNTGARRTDRKRALLRSLEKMAAAEGRVPPFTARY